MRSQKKEMRLTETFLTAFIMFKQHFCGYCGCFRLCAHSKVLVGLNYALFSALLVFQEHHEEDLFLYMTYSNESVYGA